MGREYVLQSDITSAIIFKLQENSSHQNNKNSSHYRIIIVTKKFSEARLWAGIVAGACFGAVAPAALAQQAKQGLGFETGLSIMGAYVAPTYQFSPNASLRAPFYFGSVSETRTYEGSKITGKLDAQSYALIADYYILGSGLRVSTGVGFGGLSVSGTAKNPTFNGATFTGVSTLKITQTNSVTPSFAMGYSSNSGAGIGLTADLGVRLTTYTITASDGFLAAADRAEFQAELATVNADLAKHNVMPYVALGLAYRF